MTEKLECPVCLGTMGMDRWEYWSGGERAVKVGCTNCDETGVVDAKRDG